MSNPIKEGGPAFPCTTGSDGGIFQEGMSMRDWFAGQIIGHFAAQAMQKGWTPYECANDAYEFADEMIEKRRESE